MKYKKLVRQSYSSFEFILYQIFLHLNYFIFQKFTILENKQFMLVLQSLKPRDNVIIHGYKHHLKLKTLTPT